MRWAVLGVVATIVLACGRVGSPEGEDAESEPVDGAEPPAYTGTPRGGAENLAAGGATALVPVAGSTVGGSSTSAGGAQSTAPSSTAPPAYSRECIVSHLSEQAGGAGGDAEGQPGMGGTSAGTTEDAVDAAAGSGGDAGVDLELGAGNLTVLVVFDKSGSMSSRWDERSKWQVANEALMKAIEGVLDNLTLGAIFFPDPSGCAVSPLGEGVGIELMRGADFAAHWQETAPTRSPDGATPLEAALRAADMAIERGCELGLLADRFRVVLVTDGEPTCSDDVSSMIALVAEWRRLGVETWVMGLPGSTHAAELLDAIAFAGGTERHQSLGDPSQLDDQLYIAVR